MYYVITKGEGGQTNAYVYLRHHISEFFFQGTCVKEIIQPVIFF